MFPGVGGMEPQRRWVPGARKAAQLEKGFLSKSVSVFRVFVLEISLKKKKSRHPSLSSASRLSPLSLPTHPLDSLAHSAEPAGFQPGAQMLSFTPDRRSISSPLSFLSQF